MKKVVPFAKAHETSLYGSKAVGLGDAARQGLPVPPGVALSGDLVEAVASGEPKAIEKVAKAIAAHRQSRIDEVVKTGKLKAEVAEKMKKGMEEEAARFVNEVRGAGGVFVIRREKVERP